MLLSFVIFLAPTLVSILASVYALVSVHISVLGYLSVLISVFVHVSVYVPFSVPAFVFVFPVIVSAYVAVSVCSRLLLLDLLK